MIFDPAGVLEALAGAEIPRAGVVAEVFPTAREVVAAVTGLGGACAVLILPSGRRDEVLRVIELLDAACDAHVPPLVALLAADEAGAFATYVEMGVETVVPWSADGRRVRVAVRAAVARGRARRAARDEHVRRLAENQDWLAKVLDQVIPIGAAAAREPDFDRLLERIVVEAMDVAGADGGTLYLREADALSFAILRTRSLGLVAGGTSGPRPAIPPLALTDPATGGPNHRSVAAHAALGGRSINVPDVYRSEAYDHAGALAFDARTGYRTRSLLAVPLRDGAGQVVGVLQLVNATGADGVAGAFGASAQRVVEGLAVLAAAVLSSYLREHRLRAQVRELRIEVDEARKVRQVAEITTTDYFRELQQRAGVLRKRAGSAAAAADDPATAAPAAGE